MSFIILPDLIERDKNLKPLKTRGDNIGMANLYSNNSQIQHQQLLKEKEIIFISFYKLWLIMSFDKTEQCHERKYSFNTYKYLYIYIVF